MTDLTTMAAELEALQAKATKGEWVAVDGVLGPDDEGNERSFIKPRPSEGWQIAQTCGPNGSANAALIVAAVNALPTLLDALKARDQALEPFAEAMKDFEAECFFGCLGEDGAGVVYPDETRFALVHSVDNAPRFNGGRTMDDAPDDEFGDIGSFTLGDLRRARTALEGKPA